MSNSKLLGIVIALVGIIGAAVGYVLYYVPKVAFASKHLDAALALGAIFLIAGIGMAFRPSKA